MYRVGLKSQTEAITVLSYCILSWCAATDFSQESATNTQAVVGVGFPKILRRMLSRITLILH